MKSKQILFERSSTQRVVLEKNSEGVLIAKEWRAGSDEHWKLGKGISLPSEKVLVVARVLQEIAGYGKETNCRH